jgi:hypothetical protein
VAAFDVVEVVDVIGRGGHSMVEAHRRVLSSSTWSRPQNDSMAALSKQSPTVPNEPSRPHRRTFSPKLQEVNWVPWSACRTVGPLRVLLSTAMLTALLTSAVSAVVEKVRATIMREKQSKIAQQYTLPSRAGCSVMSVHHS